ncbi:MAG: histidine triad nucleotide-binding protein [Clostridia bacterium]|nr:histidine triad nucleotide-binding protein [Clostridia bacterium]
MADCVFCRIVAGELPARVVYSDDEFLAIRDINPVAPTHVLVIPRAHVARVSELAPGDAPMLGRLLEVARRVAESEGLARGYRLVINDGPMGGQTVDHLHLHVLGGRQMTWPPG